MPKSIAKTIQQKISNGLITFTIKEHIILMIVSLFIASVFNTYILSTIVQTIDIGKTKDYLFIGSVFISLWLWILLFSIFASFVVPTKALSISIIILSATIAYMQSKYNVIYDETMIRSLFETDIDEAIELFSLNWTVYVLIAGAIPAYILYKTRLKKQDVLVSLAKRCLVLLITMIFILTNIYVFSDNYTSLLRNNRHIKDAIIPTGFIYSSYKFIVNSLPKVDTTIIPIGKDAEFSSKHTEADKTIFVIVVGETARAANFGLGSYKRNTTPKLNQRRLTDTGLIYFEQFYSCGTATAISLPCMFSLKTRRQFDVNSAPYEENVLDVIHHAGFDVIWIDNNSGCKGVCLRLKNQPIQYVGNNKDCNKNSCFDIALVSELKKLLQSPKQNLVVVLHQHGSHGPAYFERTPLSAHQFQPTCHSKNLSVCTREEIVNSYDNTIWYTDYVLNEIIATLHKASREYATAMFYVSDHGESLGEHNLYLHGMPYNIAPKEQTHVPALLWVSQHFVDRYKLKTDKLKARANESYSHDNLFHSFLGLLNIETVIYQPELDIFHDIKND